jgi:hypothetical protein
VSSLRREVIGMNIVENIPEEKNSMSNGSLEERDADSVVITSPLSGKGGKIF